MDRLLAEDLLLLRMGERSGRERPPAMPYVYGRALLADLMLAGSVTFRGAGPLRRGGVAARGAAADDELLRELASRLGRRTMSPLEASATLERGLRAKVVARMVARRSLTRLTHEADGGEVAPLDPARLMGLRRDLASGLAGERDLDEREIALLGLVDAAGELATVSPDPAAADGVAALVATRPALAAILRG